MKAGESEKRGRWSMNLRNEIIVRWENWRKIKQRDGNEKGVVKARLGRGVNVKKKKMTPSVRCRVSKRRGEMEGCMSGLWSLHSEQSDDSGRAENPGDIGPSACVKVSVRYYVRLSASDSHIQSKN